MRNRAVWYRRIADIMSDVFDLRSNHAVRIVIDGEWDEPCVALTVDGREYVSNLAGSLEEAFADVLVQHRSRSDSASSDASRPARPPIIRGTNWGHSSRAFRS
jgi:hypothetical protein